MNFIRWSRFDSAEDNSPKPCTGTWEEFSALLSTAHAPPASGRLAGLKKGMPAVSGTIFRENSRRGTESAETIHAILFDFDNAREVPSDEFWDEARTRPKLKKVPSEVIAHPEEICALMDRKGISYRAYTTWSSTPDWVKFRLVVPLKSALTPDVWESAVEYAIVNLGLDPWRKSIDIKVVRDTARLHFLPNEGAQFWGNDGAMYWINSDLLDHVTVPPLPKNNYAPPRIATDIDWARFNIDISTLQLSDLLTHLGCNLSRPRNLDDGGVKHRCTCPWGREHSHGPDGDDAVVIETPGKWPHWSCAHSGHAHMGLIDVLELAREQKIDLLDYARKLNSNLEDEAKAVNEDTRDDDLQDLLGRLARTNPITQEKLLKVIKSGSGLPISMLRGIMLKASRGPKGPTNATEDLGRRIAEDMLDRFFAGGRHLLQAIDKSWWSYSGTHWRRIPNENALRHYLLEIIKDQKECDQSESSTLDSAYKILCAMQAPEKDKLNLEGIQPRVINCRNGELWIADDGSVELRPHSAESYLSYVLDQDYDPAATCPTFEQAVMDTFSRSTAPEDVARHFQELFGYIIQPRRDHKLWVICFGQGNNGKTKMTQTLQRLMSLNAVYASRIKDVEKNDFSRANLAGKLLLIDDDVETGTILPDGLLKQLSEDKLLSARHPYHGYFDFRSMVVPVLLCNNFPSCRDLTQATQNRVMAFPFARRFDISTEKNPYPFIWTNEMSGVLNWAIAGYQRLMARGHFVEPAACLVGKKKFLAAANPLVDFIETACTQTAEVMSTAAEFYGQFRIWCDAEGHRWIPRKSDVERDLASLGFNVELDGHLKQKVVRGLRPVDARENV